MRTIALIGLLLLSLSAALQATILIVIQTGQDVLLAADTAETRTWPGGARTRAQTCKIDQLGDMVFAWAGITGFAQTDFDVRTAVRVTFDRTVPMDIAVPRLGETLRPLFERTLVAMLAAGMSLESDNLWFAVHLVRPSHPTKSPVAWTLRLRATLDQHGVPHATVRAQEAPRDEFFGTLGTRDELVRAVKDGTVQIPWDGNLPDRLTAVQKMIAVQASATPDRVGLPMDAVLVTSTGVKWMTPRFECIIRYDL